VVLTVGLREVLKCIFHFNLIQCYWKEAYDCCNVREVHWFEMYYEKIVTFQLKMNMQISPSSQGEIERMYVVLEV
jgi:hypothetical protein